MNSLSSSRFMISIFLKWSKEVEELEGFVLRYLFFLFLFFCISTSSNKIYAFKITRIQRDLRVGESNCYQINP